MTKLNKSLLAGAAIAFAGGLALPASAQDASSAPAVVKSGKKMKVKLYGEISRMFGLVSDGTNKQFRQAQNQNTASRMGVEGRGRISKGWSLGTRFEFQLVGDRFMNVEGNQTGSRERFRIRHTDAAFSHKRFGAVSIGLGDTASNGTAEVTLVPGGTAGHLGGSLHYMANGVGFRDADTGAYVEEMDVFFDSFDGAGRSTRMRYDTPVFAGAKASMSYIDGASWDAALRYSGSMGGTKIQGAVGFAMIRDNVNGFSDFRKLAENAGRKGSNLLSGSFSVRTPMGLGMTMSGARLWRIKDSVPFPPNHAWNLNPSIWYTKTMTELGPTTVEYAYQHAVDSDSPFNSDADAHAVTLFQVLENVGTDTFLTFRYYDVDTPGFNPDPVWVLGGGFRARF